MKIIRDGHFKLNGRDERVLTSPANREGYVEFTMGGMAEHAVSVSLSHFEELTGFYIKGLEPITAFNDSDELIRLKIAVKNRDLQLIYISSVDLYAKIDFATATNSHMSSAISLTSKDDIYQLKVGKKSGYQSLGQKVYEGKGLPLLINEALEQLDKYISTKVQILSSGDAREEASRVINPEGFKCLFKNEAISEYFDKQDMPAGIVINEKGRYQTFISFIASDGNMRMSCETKDYANAKNAGKNLASYGYDYLGRQLDILDKDKLEGALRESMQNEFNPSWSDSKTASFITNNRGWYEISRIKTREDDKYGTQYYFDWQFTFDDNGKELSYEIEVDARDGGNAHNIFGKLYYFVKEISNGVLNNSLEFDIDYRTLDEKATFHRSRIDEYRKQRSYKEKVLIDPTSNQHWISSAKKEIMAIDLRINHHLEMAKEIGREMKSVEVDEKLGVNNVLGIN